MFQYLQLSVHSILGLLFLPLRLMVSQHQHPHQQRLKSNCKNDRAHASTLSPQLLHCVGVAIGGIAVSLSKIPINQKLESHCYEMNKRVVQSLQCTHMIMFAVFKKHYCKSVAKALIFTLAHNYVSLNRVTIQLE